MADNFCLELRNTQSRLIPYLNDAKRGSIIWSLVVTMYTTRRNIKQDVNSGHSVCLCVWCSSQKHVTSNSLVFLVVTDWNLAVCRLQLLRATVSCSSACTALNKQLSRFRLITMNQLMIRGSGDGAYRQYGVQHVAFCTAVEKWLLTGMFCLYRFSTLKMKAENSTET
jgi:hypothetical protein